MLKGVFFDGILEVKCKRCSKINKIGMLKFADDRDKYSLILDSSGVILNISDSAGRLLGYISDELIGKYFSHICPEIPIELSTKLFGPGGNLNQESNFQLDTVQISNKGEKTPISLVLKYFQSLSGGKHIFVMVKIKNEAEGDLEKVDNENKFSSSICDFFFRVDRNGRGIAASLSIEKFFGLAPNGAVGKYFFSYIAPENRTEAEEKFKHFSSLEQAYRTVCSLGVRADVRQVPVELFFAPNYDDSAVYIGYSIMGWILKIKNSEDK